MDGEMSWGKVYILAEAVLLYALTWMYAIYLARTEYMLGVAFLVLAFLCITAIFGDHYLSLDREMTAKEEEKARRRNGRPGARVPAGGIRGGEPRRRRERTRASGE